MRLRASDRTRDDSRQEQTAKRTESKTQAQREKREGSRASRRPKRRKQDELRAPEASLRGANEMQKDYVRRSESDGPKQGPGKSKGQNRSHESLSVCEL